MANRRRLDAALVFCAIPLAACAMPMNPPRPIGPSAPSAPTSLPGGDHTDALIYAGDGSWPAEVGSLASILYAHHASYQEVSSSELDTMSADELAHFNLIIFPGGDAGTIIGSLSRETHARLRAAVQEQGLSYLGFCAGAYIAVAPAPAPGQDVIYGIGVVAGPIPGPNYLGEQGLHFAISRAAFPDGTQRDLLWYGGPITPDIPGGVIAKYPDGTPAISQIRSGKGLVIVSGLHPTANAFILTSLGLIDREAVAPDLAWEIIEAGLSRVPLRAF